MSSCRTSTLGSLSPPQVFNHSRQQRNGSTASLIVVNNNQVLGKGDRGVVLKPGDTVSIADRSVTFQLVALPVPHPDPNHSSTALSRYLPSAAKRTTTLLTPPRPPPAALPNDTDTDPPALTAAPPLQEAAAVKPRVTAEQLAAKRTRAMLISEDFRELAALSRTDPGAAEQQCQELVEAQRTCAGAWLLWAQIASRTRRPALARDLFREAANAAITLASVTLGGGSSTPSIAGMGSVMDTVGPHENVFPQRAPGRGEPVGPDSAHSENGGELRHLSGTGTSGQMEGSVGGGGSSSSSSTAAAAGGSNTAGGAPLEATPPQTPSTPQPTASSSAAAAAAAAADESPSEASAQKSDPSSPSTPSIARSESNNVVTPVTQQPPAGTFILPTRPPTMPASSSLPSSPFTYTAGQAREGRADSAAYNSSIWDGSSSYAGSLNSTSSFASGDEFVLASDLISSSSEAVGSSGGSSAGGGAGSSRAEVGGSGAGPRLVSSQRRATRYSRMLMQVYFNWGKFEWALRNYGAARHLFRSAADETNKHAEGMNEGGGGKVLHYWAAQVGGCNECCDIPPTLGVAGAGAVRSRLSSTLLDAWCPTRLQP